jgi:hypothetical protein
MMLPKGTKSEDQYKINYRYDKKFFTCNIGAGKSEKTRKYCADIGTEGCPDSPSTYCWLIK